jgi:hypothetical protein
MALKFGFEMTSMKFTGPARASRTSVNQMAALTLKI